jgi:hypothetical protein
MTVSMNIRFAIFVGVTAALGLAMPTVNADPPLASVSADALGAEGTVTIAGFKCKSVTCREGTYVYDIEGNHHRCVVVASGRSIYTCSGDCFSCAGSTDTAKLCEVAQAEDKCKLGAPAAVVQCGLIRQHTNGCSTIQPSGVPETNNGCYCNTSGQFVYIIGSCTLAGCN